VRWVGVDGFKNQWFAVVIDDEGSWDCRVFPDIPHLWEEWRAASLILIDIPIGLPEGAGERRCDREARRHLGKRRSSVFRAPCRAVLRARTYQQARLMSLAKTGKSISSQTWGIVPKIGEIDNFLQESAQARKKIREIHPEVCFWALNGAPMQHYKKTPEGPRERLRVLRRFFNPADAVLKWAKDNRVPTDDVLDALAAAVTASLGKRALRTLPETPDLDSKGLPMEIVYCPAPPKRSAGDGLVQGHMGGYPRQWRNEI